MQKLMLDWLSFNLVRQSITDLLSLLGLIDIIPLLEHKNGFMGYENQYKYDGITILYDSQIVNEKTKINEMFYKFHVIFSGQGCRTYEDLSNKDWLTLLKGLYINNTKFTRVDIAGDDRGTLDITRITEITRQFIQGNKENVRTKFKYASIAESVKGVTNYYGSPQSDVKIRIYDKGAERGFAPLEWTRCEVQLRGEHAGQFIKKYIDNQDLGAVYNGIVNYYLQYLDDTIKTKQKKPVVGWWSAFLSGTEKIRLIEPVGREYNLSKAKQYIHNQAGSTITTLKHCMTDAEFDEFIKLDRKLNKKQRDLIAAEIAKNLNII